MQYKQEKGYNIGNSNENKPAAKQGDKLVEINKSRELIYDGNNWVERFTKTKDCTGQDGMKRVIDDTVTTPDTGYVFTLLQAESDVIIATATGNFEEGAFDGATISSEAFRGGRFTSITLASGILIAYQGV